MRTGPGEDDIHILPMSYLSLYTDNVATPSSFLFFIPEETPTMKTSLVRRLFMKTKEITFFPFKFDGCSRTTLDLIPIGLTKCQRRARGMPGYTY